MLDFKRILCAVDLLKPPQAALRHAVWLARVFKTAQLDLVNVSLAHSARSSSFSSNSRRVEQLMLEHNGRQRLDRPYTTSTSRRVHALTSGQPLSEP